MLRRLLPPLCLLAACAQGTFHPEEPAAVMVESAPAGPAPSAQVVAEPAPAPVPAPKPEPKAPTRTPTSKELAQARQLFRDAVRAFDQGNYLEARQLFAQAYAVAPMPQVLYNLAMADMKDGDQQAACSHFKEWKASNPDPNRLSQVASTFASCPP
jgi:hypothetical protein